VVVTRDYQDAGDERGDAEKQQRRTTTAEVSLVCDSRRMLGV
jgi:hypothetical protein